LLIVQSRPTAIVEPSLSTFKSKECLSRNKMSLDNIYKEENSLSTKSNIHFLPFSIPYNYQFQSTNNDESDTGISSTNSNEEQLVTLV
jgi:hypothetical protein